MLEQDQIPDLQNTRAALPMLPVAQTDPLSLVRRDSPHLKTQAPLAILVIILVLVFASRVIRLNTLNMEGDEVWSVWQTFGTLGQTIQRASYDWPPGYFVLLHAWRWLTGISPFTLRLTSIFTLLICDALLFLLTRKLYGTTAALIAILALSSFGYSLFLSTLLRGYLLNLALWLVAFWMMLRYFERPSRLKGIILGLNLAAMFYVHTTAVFGYAMLGVYALLMYPRQVKVWRNWWPGLITLLLCVPEAISKLHVIGVKNKLVEFYIPQAPFHVQLGTLYMDFAGQEWALWVSFFLIASALILARWRFQRRTVVLLLWMLSPAAIFWVALYLEAFHPRHLAWVMAGIAVWIGWGLSLLPRPALIAVGAVMSIGMFGYIPIRERYEADTRPPLVTTFNALQPHVRTGDVILLDPKCQGCADVSAEEWDYFARAYFPGGLTFVTQAQNYPRIWYVAAQGKEDSSTFAELERSRALGMTLGESNLLFRLYEAPPDPVGVVFANGLHFNGIEALNDADLSLAWHEGETVRVRIWWSVVQPLTDDYSEGLYLLSQSDGHLMAQFDGPPQLLDGPKETSRWLPGRFYLEERQLQLPYPLATGDQQLWLSVYQWQDGQRIAAPGLNPDKLLPLKKIFVRAWSTFDVPAK